MKIERALGTYSISSKAVFAALEINYVNLLVGRDRIEGGNLRNLCKLKTASLQWPFLPNPPPERGNGVKLKLFPYHLMGAVQRIT